MNFISDALPVYELEHNEDIIKICQESHVPIAIKRGHEKVVVMSVKLYEEMFAKMQAAAYINANIDDIENGAKPINEAEFFSLMKAKYEK